MFRQYKIQHKLRYLFISIPCFWAGVGVNIGFVLLFTYYPNNNRDAVIAYLTIPYIAHSITPHFLFMLLNILICCKWEKVKFRNYFWSMLGFTFIILHLYVALEFEHLFSILNEMNANYTPFICLIYPIIQGVIKIISSKSLSVFKIDEVFEYTSLALVGFPYRFLFF